MSRRPILSVSRLAPPFSFQSCDQIDDYPVLAPFPSVIPVLKAGCLRVTHPSATKLSRSKLSNTPLDLHVLGTPPAFVLSQDQTLQIWCLTCSLLFYRFFVIRRICEAVITRCSVFKESSFVCFSCLPRVSLGRIRIYHVCIYDCKSFLKLFYYIYDFTI